MNFFSNGEVSTLVLQKDDLAEADAAPLKHELSALVRMLRSQIRISVRDVEHISTRRLAILLAFARTLQAQGRTVEIRCAPAQRLLFESMGLHEHLAVLEVPAA